MVELTLAENMASMTEALATADDQRKEMDARPLLKQTEAPESFVD